MSNKLSKMPNIAIPRSRFGQEFNHATSFNHGKLYPIDCIPIIPGDQYKIDLAALIRMSTPIFPIFGNIKIYAGVFFVPSRILLNDWEKFIGDPSNHDRVSTVIPVDPDTTELPYWDGIYYAPQMSYSTQYPDLLESVAVRLGKPLLVSTSTFGNTGVHMNPLKEMGYFQIWNDHFRPSNLIEPCILYKSAALGVGVSDVGRDYNGDALTYYTPCLPVCKEYDYFTASTLSPQFGGNVKLPLGTTAPVFIENIGSTSFPAGSEIGASGLPPTAKTYDFYVPGNGGASNAKLYADLSTATAATINNLRLAFQIQKYLERSNYGSKYFEILNAHYGVTNPDSRMQRAERLCVVSDYININQVLSTAGQDPSPAQKVGQLGAVSVTGIKKHLCHAAFDEFGYLYVMVWTKHDRSYDGGVLREDLYAKRFDFYSPEFANLGDQSTKKIELALYDALGNIVSPTAVFGYQEAWAELRYRRDRTSGLLAKATAEQYVKSGIGTAPTTLDVWTLTDNFEGTNVSLDKAFLFEDRNQLAHCLTSGPAGPDYIADFHIKYVKTAELPLYSIPGLIDHFGAL